MLFGQLLDIDWRKEKNWTGDNCQQQCRATAQQRNSATLDTDFFFFKRVVIGHPSWNREWDAGPGFNTRQRPYGDPVMVAPVGRDGNVSGRCRRSMGRSGRDGLVKRRKAGGTGRGEAGGLGGVRRVATCTGLGGLRAGRSGLAWRARHRGMARGGVST